MPPKSINYRSYKNFTEEQFKEAIRSNCSSIGSGNLTSLHHVIEKRFDQFALMKKIVLRGNNKPYMTSQLGKAIMKRFGLKDKANKSGKPADKTAFKTHRNLVVKLNKEVKISFLKNQITENATNKTKHFWKLCKTFFIEKGLYYK